ncbi:hypothetical protein [Stenotrophomonas maltophilia]|uniref:hypothetical protein n=1 Tax=Stenotrophomonas maltophilia TaxID=40324 RepID=UPI003896E4DB
MHNVTVTREEPFSLIPNQDNAPLFKVCAGIDAVHASLKASIYFSFVQTMLTHLDGDRVNEDEMFVLADLLEMVRALRNATGEWR